MCEPASIALGVSAVIGLATAAYSADQTRKTGNANAEIAESNAKLARDQAQVEQAIGDRESQQAQWRTQALIGQQRAAIASNGIDAGVGTPVDILGETAMFGQVDRQTIALNTARRAWGFNAQATDYQNQGAIGKFNAKGQANATILSGLSNAAGSYGRMAA